MRKRTLTKIEREAKAKAERWLEDRRHLIERTEELVGRDRLAAAFAESAERARPRRKPKVFKVSRADRAAKVQADIRSLSEQGVPVAEIARRLQLSRSYVSQVRMALGLAPKRARR